MQVMDFEEHEDGSVTLVVELTDREKLLLIEDSLRRIIHEKAKEDIAYHESCSEAQPEVQQGGSDEGQEERLQAEAQASTNTVKEIPYA